MRSGRLLASAALALACTFARAEAEAPPPAPAQPRTFLIAEYRVEGAEHLSGREMEDVLAPFLGPGRTVEDVERARDALERYYGSRNYLGVAVAIPPQTVREGVVTLKVTEGRVGRLRVVGARWYSPGDIRRTAPSLAEGTVLDMEAVMRDIVALNQLPDRRITPALRAGAVAGTYDVDLNVQDELPFHSSLELNDRFSANTSLLRLNGSVRYDNLWQGGDSVSVGLQVAPLRIRDGVVASAAYAQRFKGIRWLTLTWTGVLQQSDVSTMGSIAVAGRGRMLGARAGFALPGGDGFEHNAGAGLDVKRFQEKLTFGEQSVTTPITYVPLTLQYGASWIGKRSTTVLGLSAVMGLRGAGSDDGQFDAKRYKSSASFTYFRGELSRLDERFGLQLRARVLGQIGTDSLLSSEQLTAGGAESVRGYLEVQASGDFGAAGQVELRSPSLSRWFGRGVLDEWRFHVFTDAGWLGVRSPLPEQTSRFFLWSAGAGTRFRLFDHVSGGLDLGIPLRSEGTTHKGHPRLGFRVAGEL